LQDVVRISAAASDFIFSNREDTNLLDLGQVQGIVKRTKPERVINLAAEVTVSISTAKNDFDIFARNLTMTQNVLASCHAEEVESLVQIGSYHSYSGAINPPFSSQTQPSFSQLNFSSSYGAVKAIELMAAQLHQSALSSSTSLSNVCMPNLFGPYGPKAADREHLIGSIIRHVLRAQASGKTEVVATGNPSELREYLYTLDAASWLLGISQTKDSIPKFSVVSSGDIFSISDCWKLVATEFGYSGEIVFPDVGPVVERSIYFDERTIDPTPFQEALAKTIHWYKSSLSQEDK
jgi:nucleoside-diphosphate-sugar epimerase